MTTGASVNGRVAVVTDSTAYLPRDLLSATAIDVVPVQVIVSGRAMDETSDAASTQRIAEALKAGGYKTAHVGKWHLERKNANSADFEPVDHGFDRQVLKPASKGYFLTKPTGRFKKGDYTTDYLAAEAANIISDWKSEPFFLYFG